jgi:hypothetical protein
LNINETLNGQINDEYIDLLKNKNCIDVFRVLNNEDSGHTTSYFERHDYILFLLSDDLSDKKSNSKNNSVNDYNDLIKLIFQKYKIYFIDCTVNKISDITNYNYPVELTFIFDKKNH